RLGEDPKRRGAKVRSLRSTAKYSQLPGNDGSRETDDGSRERIIVGRDDDRSVAVYDFFPFFLCRELNRNLFL
ncbi:MAG: hypothetical protein ACI9G1_001442, partial [Pirellulaceae bacterium]